MTGEGEPTVLLVADSSDALAAAERLDGYRVETARTAEDAMASLDEGVDALLVEPFLPDRSGESLLETVREGAYEVRAGVLAAPSDGEFPSFDVRIETPVTTTDLACAVDRLRSLRSYDRHVDRLYELARQRGSRETATPPVGDGGFEGVDQEILDAREAADSALTDIPTADHDRLFVDEVVGEATDDGGH